jgi:AraC family transcriptional activator of pobA
MRVIPNYALYGDQAQSSWSNSFYFEWIPTRAGAYNWEIRPHVHEAFIQVSYFRTGSAVASINNASLEIKAPCLVLIPAQTVHGFMYSDDVDGPVVTASQRTLESIAAVVMPELVALIRRPSVVPLEDATRHVDMLMPLFTAVEREYRTHAVGQMAAGISLITALLVQIARLSTTSQLMSWTAGSRKASQIERFQTLVDRRFRTRLSLDAYANELGVTPGQLSRLCREVLGMSALDVINARLIHEAQRHLVYTPQTVKQLAGALGFDDEAYFARFFRKHTGMTPKEFRTSAMRQMGASSGAPVRLQGK